MLIAERHYCLGWSFNLTTVIVIGQSDNAENENRFCISRPLPVFRVYFAITLPELSAAMCSNR